MKTALFNKLMKSNTFAQVYALVETNCTIADEFNRVGEYLDHLKDKYVAELLMGNREQALRHAKQRACQMMGGNDKQQMATYY